MWRRFATAWVGIKFGGVMVNIFGKEENWSWFSLPWPFCCRVVRFHGDRRGRHLGSDPRILKAKFGSHEVINTIMLNFHRDLAGQLFHAVLLTRYRAIR